MADFDGMVAAMREVQDQILALPGVTGIEVGYRRAGDRLTNEFAICIYVAEKRDDVPADQRIPEEIGGFKTDVIQATFTPDQGLPDTTPYDPVPGGASIKVPSSSLAASLGTMGCLVRDNASAQLRGLSNAHVLGALGASVGDPVIQPPTGSVPADALGVIDEIPPPQIWRKGNRVGYVDCGTFTLETRGASTEIIGIGPVRGTRVVDGLPAVGEEPLRVRKRGGKTGLTHGIVRGFSGAFRVDPKDPNSTLIVGNLTIEFDPATPGSETQKWGDHGDSGAAVVDPENIVVGLHWGSDKDTGMYGVASPIDLVEDILGVTVETTPPPRVTGLVPASGSSQGGTPVLVRGAGFQLRAPGAITVTFGGQAATFAGAITDTEIAVIAPPHAAGAADVRVTNAAGTSASVPASTFTYIEAPVVDQVAPATGSPFGGQTTTISGRGFDGASAVLFGIAPAHIVSAGFTQITVLSPPGIPGLEVDVIVGTPGGLSAASNASKYRYQ